MNDELNEEQASLYVLGLLAPDDARAFEQTLEGDDALRKLVADLRAASAALPYGLPPVPPRAQLKDEIFRKLDQPRLSVVPISDREPSKPSPMVWLAALSGWVVAACVWFEVGGYQTKLDESQKANSNLSDVLHQRDVEIANMRLENEVLSSKVSLLLRRNPLDDRRLIRMGPPAQNVAPAAVVLWDDKGQSGTLLLDHLTVPDDAKDYQLWIIDPTQKAPIDCGVVAITGAGVNTIAFAPKSKVAQIGKFAITLEKKGGVPSPTVDAMVLIGG